MKIPRIVHQIWIQGYVNIPDKLLENLKSIKFSNPSFHFEFWDEPRIIMLLQKYHPKILKIYKNVHKYNGTVSVMASKSDLARYAILNLYGGLYMDIDFEVGVPLEYLWSKYGRNEFIIADSHYPILDYVYTSYKPKYYAGFFGCIPNHQIWKCVWKKILKAQNRNQIDYALDMCLQKYNSNKIVIIDPIDVSTHTSCVANQAKIKSPSSSSWFVGRKFITNVACKPKITIIIIVILIILVVLLIFVIIKITIQKNYFIRKLI